jgi:hypothetical protein
MLCFQLGITRHADNREVVEVPEIFGQLTLTLEERFALLAPSL